MTQLHCLMKISYLVEDNIQNQDLQNIEINHKEKIICESNETWMRIDEFVIKLYDFRGIYRIFWSQNSHWIVKKLLRFNSNRWI